MSPRCPLTVPSLSPLSPHCPRCPRCPQERSARATVVAWRRYRQTCELQLRLTPPAPGPVCNRTFDLYACWGDAVPNSTATVPCPWYLPWYHRVQGGVVARRCGHDARWVTDDSGRTWQDNSQCEDLRQVWLLEQFRLLYTVGYSLSLVALLVALLLLLLLRRLRCTRNLIHANLFASFALRAGAILTRDALLPHGHGHPLQLLGRQAGPACRVAQSVAQYCVGANYAWATAEGLFLLRLLLAASPARGCLPGYLLLGWGETPVIVTCVTVSPVSHPPVSLCHLCHCVIVCPHAQGVSPRCPHAAPACPRRLARSTLTLIPLLGVHEVIFALAGEAEAGGGSLRLARLCLHLLLTSAQGLVVSVLYCFTNKEVQAELRRGWQRCRLGVTGVAPRDPPRRGQRAAVESGC
uniref:Gastric inhibitory polypeptide receptor n=1 Tax=Taeniopygia guttata TaxID=59729 RepID=A0A674HL58_TAEGU